MMIAIQSLLNCLLLHIPTLAQKGPRKRGWFKMDSAIFGEPTVLVRWGAVPSSR
jgi:hypothetical protein